jgi:hypothetical protein
MNTGALDAKLQQIADTFSNLGRPVALISFIVVMLIYLGTPLLPEVARENRGTIGKILLAGIAIGLAPDIISFIFG